MRIEDLTTTTTLANNDLIVIENVDNSLTKSITVGNLKTQLGVNYTKLVCLITQSGTNAPTLTILENNTGATFTAVRMAQGVYQISASTTAFTADKTLVLSQNISFPYNIDMYRSGGDKITIGTYNSGTTRDDVLFNSSLEVRIYE